MRFRWFDLLLVIVVLVGCVTFVRIQSQLSDLHKEHARISATVGQLTITDPKLVHMQAIETHHPWQWAWRVYLPDSSSASLSYYVGSGGSGSHGYSGGSPREQICRVNLSRTEGGGFGLYVRALSGAGFSTFGSKELCDFLIEHRDQLKIEQLGDQQRAEQLKPDDPPSIMLRVSLPDKLAEEARDKFKDSSDKLLIPVVLEVTLDIR